MKKKLIITAFIVAMVIVLLLVAEFCGLFRSKDSVTVEIAHGSGADAISHKLKESEVISSEFMFSTYSKILKKSYHSGTHTFDSKSYVSIAEELSKPTKPETITVTIPEGFEQREIAMLLEEKGIVTAKEFNDAAKIENFDYWFLKDIKKREMELEGYLFPDTYEFDLNESAESIIKRMLDNFDSKFNSDMKKRTKELGFTVDQLITLASIVEREAASKDELSLVAGVFHNRLDESRESMGLLQSCATVQYVLEERKLVLTFKDIEIKSPYNTYINKGLPIGPIASPGLNCINAALYPQSTDYLYFCADGNGKHYFAKTENGHRENMKKAGLM